MKNTAKTIAGIISIVLFLVFFVVCFMIFPEIGEKILYGNHPPNKKTEKLEYSDIILSGNYECLESASINARGDLPKFIKEFNDCNT